ncbi:MAG: Crp/Fnr family transcriptional regulator [Sporolactobacillus sp.]|nr:Crp/Fnr family transcriptional regulator [Sporolactobacillus sp.]MCI1881247.1 Crp/Fnr family transcriptional regulator [Sporolactobacillus sp.]
MSVLQAEGWLEGLSHSALRQIESQGRIRTYQAKSVIFIKGKPLMHYFFVAKGLVAVYRQNRDGKRWIASLIGSETFFPHIGFEQPSAVYPANAEALTDCTLLAVRKVEMTRLMHDFSSLQDQLTRFFAEKSQELITRCSDSLLESAEHRLIQLLKQLALQSAKRTDDGWYSVGDILTEENMADYIGVTQETVSRIMTRLYRDRIVRRSGRKKICLNLQRLTER